MTRDSARRDSRPQWTTAAQRRWLAGWSLPGLIGFLFGLLVLKHAVAVELTLITWVLAFGFGLAAAVAAPKPVRLGVLGARSLGIVFIVLASTGLAALIGPVSVLILIVAGLTHPTSLRLIGGRIRRRPSQTAPALTQGRSAGGRAAVSEVGRPVSTGAVCPASPASPASALSDGELCLIWRRSYLVLQRLHQQHRDLHPNAAACLRTTACEAVIARQQQLVACRQEYLDELERRDQGGFRRWLYAGARPASDPSRYLNHDGRRFQSGSAG